MDWKNRWLQIFDVIISEKNTNAISEQYYQLNGHIVISHRLQSFIANVLEFEWEKQMAPEFCGKHFQKRIHILFLNMWYVIFYLGFMSKYFLAFVQKLGWEKQMAPEFWGNYFRSDSFSEQNYLNEPRSCDILHGLCEQIFLAKGR